MVLNILWLSKKKIDCDVYIIKKDKYVFYDFIGRWDEIKRNWEDRIVGEG